MNQEVVMLMRFREKMKSHEYFMNEAIKEAKKAFLKNEVPVGAVVVYQDKVIARAHNLRESKQAFHAHAEFLAMQKAAKKIGSWRLEECIVYVTLEPCSMCAGAMIQSRVKALYYGATDPKAGAVESVVKLLDNAFNHQIACQGGLLKETTSDLLKKFFKKLRDEEK